MPRKRPSPGTPDLQDGRSSKKAKSNTGKATDKLSGNSWKAVKSSLDEITAPNKKTPSNMGRKKQKPSSRSNQFYQSSTGASTVSPIQQSLSKMFDQYRDRPQEDPDKIGIQGVQKYLEDLGVELDEVAHIGLCELFQCQIGEIEREPFISGWRSVCTVDKTYDNVTRQTQYIASIRKKLANNPSYFKQIYRYAFKLAKPEAQRSVPVDGALAFWNMFFGDAGAGLVWNSESTKWLDLWCDYYENQNKRPVNKDLWNMVCEFVFKIKEPGGETLQWWSEDGAWPMAIDDFVAFVKEKRKINGDSMDTT